MTWNNRLAVMLISLFIISLALVLPSSAEPIKENVPPKSFLLDDPSWKILVVTVDSRGGGLGSGWWIGVYNRKRGE